MTTPVVPPSFDELLVQASKGLDVLISLFVAIDGQLDGTGAAQPLRSSAPRG